MVTLRNALSLRRQPKELTAVPRVNIVPPGYLRPSALGARTGLLLTLLLELVVAVFIYQTRGQQAMEGVRYFTERSQGAQPAGEDRIAALTARIAEREKVLRQIRDGRQELAARRKDWPTILAAIFSATPNGITVVAVRDLGDAATVNGAGDTIELINTYRERLAAQGHVRGVTVTALSVDRATGKNSFGLSVALK